MSISQPGRYVPIYVVNVRVLTLLKAYGFLPGKPIKDAGVGNLGFQDREYLSNESSRRAESLMRPKSQSVRRYAGFRSILVLSAGMPRG